jgi:hypothetical protein
MFEFQYDDGGRAAAGYRGETGDCVCRSIAIVTGRLYAAVYADLSHLCKHDRKSMVRGKTTARNGVFRTVYHDYILSLGLLWTPTMGIGTGCMVHLNDCEIRSDQRLIVRVSKHLTAVVNGVIRDTADPSRGGARCVYGYYAMPDQLT